MRKISKQNSNTKEKLEKQIKNINLELENNTAKIKEYQKLLMEQKTILSEIQNANNQIKELDLTKISKDDIKKYIDKEKGKLEKKIKQLKSNILNTNKIKIYFKTKEKQVFDLSKIGTEEIFLINKKTSINKEYLAKLNKIKIIDIKTKKYLEKKIEDFNYERDLIEKTTQVIKIFPYDKIKKLMENYNKALQKQYKLENLSSGISLKKQKINNNLVNIKKDLINIDSILEKTYNFIKDNNPSEFASTKEKEIFTNFKTFYDKINLSDTLNKLEANFIRSDSNFFKSFDTVTNQSNKILDTFKKNIKINKPKSAINSFISFFRQSNNQKKSTENIAFLEKEIDKKYNNSLKSKKER